MSTTHRFNSWDMRVRSCFTLITFFVLTGLNAQSPRVIWGEEARLDRRNNAFTFLGADEDKLYLKKDQQGNEAEWMLDAYDLDSLNQRGAKVVSVSGLGDGEAQIEEVIDTGNNFIALYTTRQRNGERYVYLAAIDHAGNLLDLPVSAGAIPEVRNAAEINLGLAVSPDSSKVLLHYSARKNSTQAAVFSLYLFEQDLTLIHRKQLELPYPADLISIDQMLVDNAGTAYMLSGVTHRKSMRQTRVFGEESKRYLLFSFNFAANKLKEFDVNLKDKWVIGVTYGLTPGGTLAIGGFYSNDMYFSIAGTFYLTVDSESQQVLSSNMKPFEKDFIREFNDAGSGDGGRELNNYYFDHFFLNEDGSARFVAEQFYVTQRWMMDPATGRETISYAYHYNDLIVVSVDSTGMVEWTKRIPKRQFSVNDNGPYSSYALSWDGESLDIVFNDDQRNFELIERGRSDLYSFSSLNKAVVTWVRVGADGSIGRKALFESREANTILRPGIAFQAAPGELIVYAQLRKNYRFGRIIFP